MSILHYCYWWYYDHTSIFFRTIKTGYILYTNCGRFLGLVQYHSEQSRPWINISGYYIGDEIRLPIIIWWYMYIDENTLHGMNHAISGNENMISCLGLFLFAQVSNTPIVCWISQFIVLVCRCLLIVYSTLYNTTTTKRKKALGQTCKICREKI